ncbi:MAG: LacI family DNA-binding transcriptional regulator [Deinococcota bacterium]
MNLKPTIADVAKEAGVSTGTVSRVINARDGVKQVTRDNVLAAMERLNYRPDQAARELALGGPLRVGLHISAATKRLTPFFTLFLEYLMVQLRTDGYLLEDIASQDDGMPADICDAMVLFGSHEDDPRIDYLLQQGVPTVLLGVAQGVRWVAPDDYGGGRLATEHLLRLGHQDIAHVSGLMHAQAFFNRYAGYQDALRDALGETAQPLLLEGDTSSLGGYRTVRRALEAGVNFSAVFAASDELAVGVIGALEDAGLRVPTDVSVVGFDDLPEIGEALTTVRQDLREIASMTVTLLKEALSGASVRSQVMPVRLIVRGTTTRRR